MFGFKLKPKDILSLKENNYTFQYHYPGEKEIHTGKNGEPISIDEFFTMYAPDQLYFLNYNRTELFAVKLEIIDALESDNIFSLIGNNESIFVNSNGDLCETMKVSVVYYLTKCL